MKNCKVWYLNYSLCFQLLFFFWGIPPSSALVRNFLFRMWKILFHVQPLIILFCGCLIHRPFSTFSSTPVERFPINSVTGLVKGSKPTERLFEKTLNKILHSYEPFFISALAREISRDKNVDVDWSSNNDTDFSSATLSRNVALIVSRYSRFVCVPSSLASDVK